MATITLHDEQPITATCVPNIFIDEYMTQANGEYVKIYLYLLRSINRSGSGFSLSEIADHFDCTERDILRALKYWEKRRLFRLEYDEDKNLSAICFVTDAGHETPIATQEEQPGNTPVRAADRFAAAADAPAVPSSLDLSEFCGKEDVQELVFITEQYLGRTLNQTDLATLFFWYDKLHFPTELIEYLIENCVAKGHSNLRYMQRIAEDYAARNIHTVDEARVFSSETSTVYQAVMKAFGIRGRNLVPSEIDLLTYWTGTLGFSVEMIAEACARTIRTIHEQSFPYANSILEHWHEQGIRTLEEAERADAAYQQSQQGRRAAAGGSGNRFLNFTQRDNDYEEIQAQLIKKSFTGEG